jgi:predicted Zn-dependent protease
MYGYRPYGSGARGGLNGRLLIALAIIAFSLFSYYGKSEVNPYTGRKQSVAMTKGQEIALGLQAAPRMTEQYGGLDRNAKDRDRVQAIGERLLKGESLLGSNYRYQFHLLADAKTLNAFALPGGQLFITRGLYNKLTSDAQIAGVMAHEIGHVVGRHGAAQMAKQQLTQGLASAAGVAAGDNSGAQLAMMVGQVVGMKYGREDELESDTLGLRFMAQAGYDPRAMVGVMKVLGAAGGGRRQPEFFSTHPNPKNRIEVIEQTIQQMFPQGVPEELEN